MLINLIIIFKFHSTCLRQVIFYLFRYFTYSVIWHSKFSWSKRCQKLGSRGSEGLRLERKKIRYEFLFNCNWRMFSRKNVKEGRSEKKSVRSMERRLSRNKFRKPLRVCKNPMKHMYIQMMKRLLIKCKWLEIIFEVLDDLVNDEMSEHFKSELVPKVLVTTSPRAKLVVYF